MIDGSTKHLRAKEEAAATRNKISFVMSSSIERSHVVPVLVVGIQSGTPGTRARERSDKNL